MPDDSSGQSNNKTNAGKAEQGRTSSSEPKLVDETVTYDPESEASTADHEAATLPPSDVVSHQHATKPRQPFATHSKEEQAEVPSSDVATTYFAGPVHVPGYEILEELGRGGMGVVYKARHTQLNRLVALKMILAGGHASADDLVRFLSEAEAVAAFAHRNVVEVYDFGRHHNLPYMALEFIQGGSLAHKLKDGPLPAQEAAHLVEQLAHGMNAAHQVGIVHRDLKPANVLLESRESEIGVLEKNHAGSGRSPIPDPRSPMIPKITDFGLAKKFESGSGLTQTGAVMGTPSYMAPEQASGQTKRVGPAADVYALGAILYECLTGRPPFRADTAMDTVLKVIYDEPPPPAQLNPKIPKDLATICLKCLHKDPRRRYPSAEALAEDLRRWQTNRPITARRVGRIERLQRWCKRNPRVAGLGAAVILVLAAGLIGIVWEYRIAKNNEQRAIQNEKVALAQKRTAEKLTKVADQKTAEALREKKRADRQLALARSYLFAAQLQRVAAVYRLNPYQGLQLLHNYKACPINLRNAAWWFYERQCRKWDRHTLRGHTAGVRGAAFSPTGELLASVGSDKSVRLWDIREAKQHAAFQGHTGEVLTLAFAPNGQTLATAGADATVRLWNVSKGIETRTLTAHHGSIRAVVFSPDGRSLISAGDDRVIQGWEVGTGKNLFTLEGHKDTVRSLAFSPDGKSLASASDDNTIKIWNLESRQCRSTLAEHRAMVFSVAFSPDGRTLASGSLDTTIKLWDVAEERAKITIPAHDDGVWSIAFSPDGRTLASASSSKVLKLWNVFSGRLKVNLQGHEEGVTKVDFSPDGKILASASDDQTIKLWDVASDQDKLTLWGHEARVSSLAVSPDGKVIASASYDTTVRLWDVGSGHELKVLRGHTQGLWVVAFSPDGKTIASAGLDRVVRLWDVATGKLTRELSGHSDGIWALAFSPDGATLATGSDDRTVKLWEVATGRETATLSKHASGVKAVVFSPDGATLASAGDDAVIRLWDTKNDHELAVLKGHKNCIWALAISPGNGKLLASAGDDTDIKLWDLASGREIATFRGHADSVGSVAFGPKGVTLASASDDQTIRLWEVATGQQTATIHGHKKQVWVVAFGPDGRTLASAGDDQTIKLWDISKDYEIAVLKGHSSPVAAVFFSENGSAMKSVDEAGESRYWDLSTGQALLEQPEEHFNTDLPSDLQGKMIVKIDGRKIRLLDPTQPDDQSEWHRLIAANPDWHREQAERAKRLKQWFATGFHLGKAANLQPWDTHTRLQEALAWAQADENAHAARAFVQALLSRIHLCIPAHLF